MHAVAIRRQQLALALPAAGPVEREGCAVQNVAGEGPPPPLVQIPLAKRDAATTVLVLVRKEQVLHVGTHAT
eukprot:4256195-Alexandrium_andersonii.AAC.1